MAADESTIEDIANFATQMGVIYPVLIGNKPSANLYGGDYVLPTTYFIDRGLASSWAGGLGWEHRDVVERRIKQALGQTGVEQK